MRKDFSNLKYLALGESDFPKQEDFVSAEDISIKANLNFTETVSFVTSWYTDYYENQSRTMFDYSSKQITEFVSIAKNKKISWAQ